MISVAILGSPWQTNSQSCRLRKQHISLISFFQKKKVPELVDLLPYKTYPSRDAILALMRERARKYGLYERTMFNTSVEKVKVLNSDVGSEKPRYGVYHVPCPSQNNNDTELFVAGAVLAWPGNLCFPRSIQFPGEHLFGGYIAYGSAGKTDYARVKGKVCILYGHGAYTLENVRTLLEHQCKKVWVLCRKRNLAGMRMASWLCQYTVRPVPGTVLVDFFQIMYDLVGFDVWSAHSVHTDAKRSFAHFEGKTIFGVNDVYFLAEYYGLMEVVVDEIERCGEHCVYTKKDQRIDCEVIIKAIGTIPDPTIDRMLGLKEVVGLWVNGDPFRSVNTPALYLNARNFSSFSNGPAFAVDAIIIDYFLDYPDDFEDIREHLPKHSKSDVLPAYVQRNPQAMMKSFAFSSLPELSHRTNVIGMTKATRTQSVLPVEKILAECRSEWEMYTKMFKDAGQIDDRLDPPPYPYTAKILYDAINKVERG